MGETKQKHGRRGIKGILILAAVLVGLPVLVLSSLTFVVTHIDYPEVEFALPTNITDKVSAFVTNKTITAKLDVKRGKARELSIRAKGRLLDWPYTLDLDADYSLLGRRADVVFDFRLDGTVWQITGSAKGTPSEWRAEADLKKANLSETDPVLSSLLVKLPMPAVSNLVFSGSVEASASAEKTEKIPVTVWSAKGRLRDVDASCRIKDKPLEIRKFATSFGAEGIADRKTIRPMYPRIASAEYDGIGATNVSANIRMTETSLLVTEAGAGFCGGEVKLYSLFLNPKSLTTGFTLFLDGIDTNEIVTHLKGFRGSATGRLHGKLPVFLKNGSELRLRNAYLYSIPGEVGTVRFDDATPILENLAASGVDAETTSNLSKVLANLSYKSLKFDLKREEDGEGLALGMSIDGSATHGGTTVPVSFAITLHGDLEQLINTGLKIK